MALVVTSMALEKNSCQKFVDKWVEAVLCYELQLVTMATIAMASNRFTIHWSPDEHYDVGN